MMATRFFRLQTTHDIRNYDAIGCMLNNSNNVSLFLHIHTLIYICMHIYGLFASEHVQFKEENN